MAKGIFTKAGIALLSDLAKVLQTSKDEIISKAREDQSGPSASASAKKPAASFKIEKVRANGVPEDINEHSETGLLIQMLTKFSNMLLMLAQTNYPLIDFAFNKGMTISESVIILFLNKQAKIQAAYQKVSEALDEIPLEDYRHLCQKHGLIKDVKDAIKNRDPKCIEIFKKLREGKGDYQLSKKHNSMKLKFKSIKDDSLLLAMTPCLFSARFILDTYGINYAYTSEDLAQARQLLNEFIGLESTSTEEREIREKLKDIKPQLADAIVKLNQALKRAEDESEASAASGGDAPKEPGVQLVLAEILLTNKFWYYNKADEQLYLTNLPQDKQDCLIAIQNILLKNGRKPTKEAELLSPTYLQKVADYCYGLNKKEPEPEYVSKEIKQGIIELLENFFGMPEVEIPTEAKDIPIHKPTFKRGRSKYIPQKLDNLTYRELALKLMSQSEEFIQAKDKYSKLIDLKSISISGLIAATAQLVLNPAEILNRQGYFGILAAKHAMRCREIDLCCNKGIYDIHPVLLCLYPHPSKAVKNPDFIAEKLPALFQELNQIASIRVTVDFLNKQTFDIVPDGEIDQQPKAKHVNLYNYLSQLAKLPEECGQHDNYSYLSTAWEGCLNAIAKPSEIKANPSESYVALFNLVQLTLTTFFRFNALPAELKELVAFEKLTKIHEALVEMLPQIEPGLTLENGGPVMNSQLRSASPFFNSHTTTEEEKITAQQALLESVAATNGNGQAQSTAMHEGEEPPA